MTARHRIDIRPRPKMDAADLVAAYCACGDYESGPSTRHGAADAGNRHIAAVSVNEAADVLDAGLTWLFDTEQPAGAVCHHLGFSVAPGDRTIGFIPDVRFPIVTMCLAYPERDDHDELTNPLTKHDVTDLAAFLTRRGRVVRDQWNGRGTMTVSMALAGHVHPTLRDAVERYHQGCPEHKTVFCGREDLPCPWFADGNRVLVKPVWPRTRDMHASGVQCTTCRGYATHKIWCDTVDGRGDR